jgi:hypothetical protein
MRRAPGGGSLAAMPPSSQPNEFRYTSNPLRGAISLLLVASVLFFASLLTGAWALAALLHASYLHANDLPVGDNVSWGVALLVLATMQGVAALLVLFNLRVSVPFGIAVAVINIFSHIGAISAWPAWSLLTMAANAGVIYVLLVFGPRRRS